MEDTSFAIHPGKESAVNEERYYDIGNVLVEDLGDRHVSFVCEKGFVQVLFTSEKIVRIVMNPNQQPLLDDSFVVENTIDPANVTIENQVDTITMKTSNIEVKITKNPLRIQVQDVNGNTIVSESDYGMVIGNQGSVACYKDASPDEYYYGFGEKSGFLNKQGEKLEMWNSDVYAPHNPETDPLYQSIPFFMTLRNGSAHGIYLDNTYRSSFDMRTEADGNYIFQAAGGQLDYYVCAGPTPKEVIEQYTSLTGRMPIPPKWAIGYHQSRYSYESAEEVKELVRTFREKDIPLDAVHLDIHYMDGYRVFTFNQNRFPDPEKLIREIGELGVKAVPIVDPGVKADAAYQTYYDGVTNDLFCKYIEGDVFFGDVWPGKSAFPDFLNPKTRNWWGKKHEFYTAMGIEGIWNDMNEPAVFNETKTMDEKVVHRGENSNRLHKEVHNVYGNLMAEATYDGMKDLMDGKRPFLLTRAGFSGIQKYAAVWTGDNRSFWEHLEMAIPMCLNLGVSGVPFSGADVGGFAHDSNGELLARWTQFGAFTPYFRNHSAIGFARQEPWSFGEKYEEIVRDYIQLRYKWMPHLYTLFQESSQNGVPVMRPMFMEYPDDPETYTISDQFLIGEKVLVAPILRPGVTDRMVYLPEGTWYDYWTGEMFEGDKRIITHAPLEKLPIFIKRGAILPEGEAVTSSSQSSDKIKIHLYPEEARSHYTWYDDDGSTFAYEEGKYALYLIDLQLENSQVNVQFNCTHAGFDSTWKSVEFKLHGVNETDRVVINGNEVDHRQPIVLKRSHLK
ncbi:glycoside hydrolase family 31 protein [Halalkalibacillus halophilus]|uniref:glycoside hydrolase family 31 protein n=1 Tax=Halalkalibacillus halophilus TaxID=392827 RepID=UPI0004082725|nr:glycoside hydrolase family 31 protein [Halalkalibacillus halophilus]